MAKKPTISYQRTDVVLAHFAAEIVRGAKLELGTKTIGKNKTYGVASRTLQNSLAFAARPGGLDFFANAPADKYAIYIHEGVNGTQIKRGSPFSFRDKQPPISAIREWMATKPIRLRDPNTGAFIKQTEEKLNAAAFNIARGIKRKGIPGVPYFENSAKANFKKWGDKLADAMAEDLEIAMFNTINNNIK